MRGELYYFLSWRPRCARCTWCSASRCWRRAGSLRKWCSQDPPPLALRFQWHRGSRVRGRRGRYLWWHLSGGGGTVFVGGPEVVLDCFDDIGLDILFFLEGDGGSVDELSIAVLGDGGGARRLHLGILNFGREQGHSPENVRQHIDWWYKIINKTNSSFLRLFQQNLYLPLVLFSYLCRYLKIY